MHLNTGRYIYKVLESHSFYILPFLVNIVSGTTSMSLSVFHKHGFKDYVVSHHPPVLLKLGIHLENIISYLNEKKYILWRKKNEKKKFGTYII